MFIIHSAQFLRQTHQREVGETGHQSYQLGLQLHCLVWFYEKKAHGGRREKLLGGKRVLWNVSFETPLLASWQGRKKERKEKQKKKTKKTMEDLLKHSDEKEARADFLAESGFSLIT